MRLGTNLTVMLACLATSSSLSFLFRPVACELYTSVAEISRWTGATSKLSRAIQRLVQEREQQLQRLRQVAHPLIQLNQELQREFEDKKDIDSSTIMENPVNAFVILSRLHRALDQMTELLSSDPQDSFLNEWRHMLAKLAGIYDEDPSEATDMDEHLPTYEDLIGSGQALLRLQLFYDLRLCDLVDAFISWKGQEKSTNASSRLALRMNGWDCFQLGKIAFREDLFSLAILWLTRALEFVPELEQDDATAAMMNQVLDYMAFAAYKLDMIEYSANLTRTWLEREPHNQRARDNLEQYLDMLAEQRQLRGEQIGNEKESVLSLANRNEERKRLDEDRPISELHQLVSLSDYSPTSDPTVRRLCRDQASPPTGRCELVRGAMPPLKLEILHEEPRIVRLHEIVTAGEAAHFKRQALPLLERSTVNEGARLRTSDFRIAKTAWLASGRDEIVARVERRLAVGLNISMHSAEHFQVVNYGLGGFYGPHLDSARSPETEGQKENNNSTLLTNDRLATILIYLNRVEAGGATVFPRLNLSVAPLERSALVWFNLRPDARYSDERTLHTGCPVLLGSKWIATKWPRERANSFVRPCPR